MGVVKINSDASLVTEGWIGLGVVARDVHGDVLFAATRRIRAWWPPEVAESKAILLAIKLVRSHGYGHLIIESDSQVLINRLS